LNPRTLTAAHQLASIEATRDPRIDPQAGDIIQSHSGRTVFVVVGRASLASTADVIHWSARDGVVSSSLEDWRHEARRDVVVAVGGIGDVGEGAFPDVVSA